MDDLTQRPFPFSNGRPGKHVFQTVATHELSPKQRYARWGEEVIRSFHVAPADERQRRDFKATVTSLANASGEMHYVVADGYQVHQPRHAIRDELALFLMLEGQARVTYQDGTAWRVDTGGFFLLDGARTTKLAWSRHVVIQLDLPRPLLESAFCGALPAPARINAALARSPLAGLLRGQLTQFPALAPNLAAPEQQALLDASEALAITTMAAAFTAHAGTRCRPHEGLFNAAQRMMHRQLDDPRLDVAALARQLGCSRATLYRAFAAQELGVAEYLREHRLRQAYRLLQEASAQHTIADLAARCGFIDHASFSRLFHRRFGVRPSDVRHPHHTP